MSDPQTYRTKKELQEYQKIDAIERLKTYISENKITSNKKIEELEEKVENEVMEAIEFAEEADFPRPEALYEDMFAGENPTFHE